MRHAFLKISMLSILSDRIYMIYICRSFKSCSNVVIYIYTLEGDMYFLSCCSSGSTTNVCLCTRQSQFPELSSSYYLR